MWGCSRGCRRVRLPTQAPTTRRVTPGARSDKAGATSCVGQDLQDHGGVVVLGLCIHYHGSYPDPAAAASMFRGMFRYVYFNGSTPVAVAEVSIRPRAPLPRIPHSIIRDRSALSCVSVVSFGYERRTA